MLVESYLVRILVQQLGDTTEHLDLLACCYVIVVVVVVVLGGRSSGAANRAAAAAEPLGRQRRKGDIFVSCNDAGRRE